MRWFELIGQDTGGVEQDGEAQREFMVVAGGVAALESRITDDHPEEFDPRIGHG